VPCRRQLQQGWKRRVDVALEVDLAGDVRARKAELAGSGDDSAEGVGRAHDEAGARILGPEHGPVREGEGERSVPAQVVVDDGGGESSARHTVMKAQCLKPQAEAKEERWRKTWS
jgi:hypothetical protein